MTIFEAGMRVTFVCILLAGCASPAPDPAGPTVLREAVTVEVPIPVHREPPPDLMQPMDLPSPDILPAGQGDYGITRAGLETLIDAHRAVRTRLSRWRAWAQ